MLSVAVVFLRRGNMALKVMLGAFAAFLLIPALGLLANDLTFPRYRFMFMAGLFIGAAVASVLSDTTPLSKRELTLTGIGLAVFAAVDAWACSHLIASPLMVVVPVGLGVLTWGLFALESRAARSVAFADATVTAPRQRPTAMRLGIVVLLVAGIAVNAVASFDRHFNPELNSYLPFGTVLNRYENGVGAKAASLPTDGLQRVDKQLGVLGSHLGVSQNNDPLAQGFAGLDFYYSIMAEGTHTYTKGLANRAKRLAWDFEGFDDRAALDTLNGVRYYISPAKGTTYVPYGFKAVSTLATQTVYENSYALPVGYVYHAAVASDTYAALAPLDKQQSLLQGIVLGDGVAPDVPRISPALETVEVTYTLKPSKGLSWNQSTRDITVRKRNAAAKLTFAPVKDAELYLQLDGISFLRGDELTAYAAAAGPRKRHAFVNESREYFWGDRTLLVNLGYYRNGTSRAVLGFREMSNVRYSSLKVIAVPMKQFAKRVGQLGAEGMRDVRVGTDTLSGTVTSHGAGVLFLSIPFSRGWSATVDGAPAQVVPANDGLSGLPVSSGTHQVQLRYHTPGLVLGTWISLLALALAVALGVRTEMRLAATRTQKGLCRFRQSPC